MRAVILFASTQTRTFHQFLIRQHMLVYGLRYTSSRDPQRVKNTTPVVSLAGLVTHQLAPPHDETGEKSGLTTHLLTLVDEFIG